MQRKKIKTSTMLKQPLVLLAALGTMCYASEVKRISLTHAWKSSWTKGFTVRYHKCWRDTSHDAIVDKTGRVWEKLGFEPTANCPKDQNGNWSIYSTIPGGFSSLPLPQRTKIIKIRNGKTLVLLKSRSDDQPLWWIDYECNGISNKDLWLPSFSFSGSMAGTMNAREKPSQDLPPSVFEAFAHGIRCDEVKKAAAGQHSLEP